jgi:hypothetical protein
VVPLRRLNDEEYNKVRELQGQKGPSLPTLLEAGREKPAFIRIRQREHIKRHVYEPLVDEYRAAGRCRAVTNFVELTRKIGNQVNSFIMDQALELTRSVCLRACKARQDSIFFLLGPV